ncbi:hypothetical protein ABW19_dt0210273 [Dactylella cylindrospora]|nr:hypothetical protein ABW19_dt0210273 [Dactylella cylindrospora]
MDPTGNYTDSHQRGKEERPTGNQRPLHHVRFSSVGIGSGGIIEESVDNNHHQFPMETLGKPQEIEETARSKEDAVSGLGNVTSLKLEEAAALTTMHGPLPLLSTTNPYIRREEFDESAAPVGPTAEGIDPDAKVLARQLTQRFGGPKDHGTSSGDTQNTVSGLKTPSPEDYNNIPAAYKPGVLASLLKLAQDQSSQVPSVLKLRSRPGSSSGTPPSESGTVTPSKWYKPNQMSTASLLAGTSAQLAGAYTGTGGSEKPPIAPKRPKPTRSQSGGIANVLGRFSKGTSDDEIKLRFHIAHTLQKQRYLLQLCKALMLYGAPTHRLEEYLKMSAKVLDIEGQFLYMPGCMIISFDDSSTHTSNMQLVRVTQSLDLGKLQDVHLIYKEVVHDIISVEEGMARLQDLFTQGPRFPLWLQVLVYGAASAAVGPLFSARLIDLPICFILGSILGTLALVVAPRSTLYSNVFEIVACVVICFLARAFGSIRGGSLFCFSGIAQASIALILPGYIVRFGITIGSALYGAIDSNATSATSCSNIMSEYYKFLFVVVFTLCLNILNQCKWKQIPISLFISASGFVVNFFATKRFPSNVQVANALGAFAIGVVGNLYSRVSHQIAFTSIVPAIFIQVPSGLAAQGGLISGLQTADSLTNKTTTASAETLQNQFNSTIAGVALGMIQVAIGISVGLFFAAIAVYPFGKRRSGLFTF